jgi:glycosyltransferase involved in cell wall biosynthesis
MKILLVGNYAPDRQESMLRFAGMLEDGLKERGHEVRLVQPPVVLGKWVADPSPLKKWLGYIDKLILYPPQLRRQAAWADIIHICDHSNAIYSTTVSHRPSVITCHDLLAVRSALGEFPENTTGRSGRIYQRLIRRGLRKAPVIVCVSDATRHDVVRLINKGKNELSVIYNGLNYPYSPMDGSVASRHLTKMGLSLEQDFLLHVGGNQWYKNRLGVLRIFRRLLRHPSASHLHLVLAGKPWTGEMKNYIGTCGIEDRVTQLTGVSNEDLRALYSTAKGLLFPSLCEGFGWPIIEAQACGCRVFTSNRVPMNEIGGNCAVYIDPQEPDQAAERIAEALLGPGGGGAEAVRNAGRFTPGKMIDGYIAAYRAILDASGQVVSKSKSDNPLT